MTIIERLVKALSYEGSVVLDFFAGSAVTTRVAMELGRHSLSSDLSPDILDYFRQAHEELAASGPLGPQHSLPPSESKRPGRPPGLRKGCESFV